MQWIKRCQQAGRMPAWLLVGVAVGVVGCGSDIPSTPVTTGLTLSCPQFETNVNPIFDADIGGRTCSSSSCHAVNGGSGGAFRIYPNALPGSLQMEANFLAAKGFANLTSTPDSKLLLEPLAGSQPSVGPHSGGDIFPDTLDTNYTTIETWIDTRIQGPSTCLP